MRFAKLKTFASNNGFQTIGAAKITVKEAIFACPSSIRLPGRHVLRRGLLVLKLRSRGFPEGLPARALYAPVRNVVNVNGGGKIAIPREKPLIKKNAFVHMGIAEATIHYLRLAGTNQKHRQIVEALLKGGKQSNAKRFTDAVRSILNREAQSEGSPLYWSGKDWGLKDMIISREEDLRRFHS